MNGLKSFDLPVKVAGLGSHKYEFHIDDYFFSQFEDSLLSSGKFSVEVLLDKRPNIMELTFKIEGVFKSPCDLCLAEIEIPVSDDRRILVKYSEVERNEEDEVIYISREESHLNVGGLIYEFIILALPISRRIDCESNNHLYCDQKVLAYLSSVEESDEDDEDDEDLWQSLKDITLN